MHLVENKSKEKRLRLELFQKYIIGYLGLELELKK